MSGDELCYRTISETARLIESGSLSPVELTQAHLDRIGATDSQLNSFITLLAERALEQAKSAEIEIASGTYRGPLHGIPIGLKDLYYTRYIRTTIGSKILRDFVPEYDAAVVEKFDEAGAVLLGKLQMHEFALGATSVNPHDGPAHNPWDVTRITGGSSGGSGSAVSSGQCMAALGSDTGGSIRIPAGLCGIVGMKPTFGRISRHGVHPLSWSLDTVGPMTRSAHDAAIVMNALAGHDSRDPSSAQTKTMDFTHGISDGISGLKIGIPEDFFYDVIDSEVSAAICQAAGVLAELGAVVESCSIPALNHCLGISSAILVTEAAETLFPHIRDCPDDIGADVRARLYLGAMTPAVDYIKAQRARAAYNEQLADAMETYDLLMAPTAAIGAPGIDQEFVEVNGRQENALSLMSRLTRAFNLTGQPTVSVPCGFTSDGIPIGMQLAGRMWEDSVVLRAAHTYESATEWHTRRPPIQ
ncbi:MAG: amidase [Dehalococcoidia bacterium]|nr:amidase [Dehalococcoidia bacterium]